MTEPDRIKINSLFSQYGSKWSKGIEHIEKDYHVAVSKTNRQYDIEITSRFPPALKLSLHLGDDEKGNTTFTYGPSFVYPELPELAKDELYAVDRVLKSHKHIWMVTPGNHYLQFFDLSNGLESFKKQKFSEASRHEGKKTTRF